MNNQQFLFARVGFSARVLSLLSVSIQDRPIGERTIRKWVKGQSSPRNPFYLDFALKMDTLLTQKALAIINGHKEYGFNKVLALPNYKDDSECQQYTGKIFPIEIYQALVQRIFIFAGNADTKIRIEFAKPNSNQAVDIGLYLDFDLFPVNKVTS